MTVEIGKWNLTGGILAQVDCHEWIPSLPKESIQLIAIDPPFFTGRVQSGSGPNAPRYRDHWAGGKSAYLGWLMERIEAMWGLIAPTGSLLVHLDWHAVHAVKVALDERFGEDRFQNEIIWYYQTGGASKKRFSRKHDTLLWYTKSDKWVFHPERIRIPRTEKALHRARNPKGARISLEDNEKNPDDVLFIPALNPMSNERTGYPTQKPVELMEPFILALTEDGDTVADFFCGSGTTLVAAQRLGRKWLGCDVSAEAVEVARGRLESYQSLF
jgi:DNA modification methylase